MSELKNNYVEENKYELLSKFDTVQEFNNHFEQAMLMHKDKFTKSEYIALNKLRKFAYSENSPNTIGVAWSKAQKVVSATHKEMLFGISRSTFDRMLRKAKKLNLIKVIHQFRKNKYQKHSVYVFNRLEELVPDVIENVEIVSKTNTIDEHESVKINESRTILLKLPVLKDLNTYQQAGNVPTKELNENDSETKKTCYQEMKETIDGLFADKTTIYRLYGVWLAQTKKMFKKPPFRLGMQAIRVLIGEVKRRISLELKPLRNPVGYFNGVVTNLIDDWILYDYE